MRIVITGGTGQVGQLLARHFHSQGHEVVVIARHVSAAPWRTVEWDAASPGYWVCDLDGADVLINLAGRSVNCRYNPQNREEITRSRVHTTEMLGWVIGSVPTPPRLWLNASTATIYRHSLDRPMDEATGELGGDEPDAPESWAFSIEVAKSWESALFAANVPHTRRVALRSAMTMSPDPGGVLDTMVKLVRRGLGGPAGDGKQFVSWIHYQDFVRAVEFLVTNDTFEGPVNICSPHPIPNAEFMQALREACGQKRAFRASPWMLELGAMLLKTETELVLKSRRVVPGKLLEAGFQFLYPLWPEAARDLLSGWPTAASRAA